jgi:hypothetical protein
MSMLRNDCDGKNRQDARVFRWPSKSFKSGDGTLLNVRNGNLESRGFEIRRRERSELLSTSPMDVASPRAAFGGNISHAHGPLLIEVLR